MKAKRHKPPSYKALMATPNIGQLAPDVALERIGLLIDASEGVRKRGGARRALEWADKLQANGMAGQRLAVLDYFRANAWDKLRARAKVDGETWVWVDHASEQAVYFLRRAKNSEAFKSLPVFLRCQILTNLGAELSRIGRAPEAIELWDAALVEDPRFWMARGNRAKGLSKFGRYLYDDMQRAVLYYQAMQALEKTRLDAAAHPEFGDPSALANFEQEYRWLAPQINAPAIAAAISGKPARLGKSKEERIYRRWCLQESLFLDPLNEAKIKSVAPADVLMLPSFVTKLKESPSLIGFFNQIKQEYASARYQYFLAIQADGPHFSDRGMRLANTLDYPSYGLAVERVRTSFRITYSLFDKMAYFLNAYFKLGMKPTSVTFDHVWKEKVGKTTQIRKKFARSKNPPLHALYWLSKDLFEGTATGVLDPDARSLHEYRRLMEHRYFKVHELRPSAVKRGRYKDLFDDTLAYSVSRDDLERKALRALKLARAGIIYLALAMHREEQYRKARRRSQRPLAGQSLPPVDDRWKQ
jgi:tetratricopeptide (TPR) repeat protein